MRFSQTSINVTNNWLANQKPLRNENQVTEGGPTKATKNIAPSRDTHANATSYKRIEGQSNDS